jgi:membrane protein
MNHAISIHLSLESGSMNPSQEPPGDSPAEKPEPTGDETSAAEEASKERAQRIKRMRHLQQMQQAAVERGKHKYAGSSAQSLWDRLSATDFLNQALLLAATLLLCAIPFFLVLNALAGRSLIPVMTHRMGLTKQASDVVGQLFTSTAATSSTITGLSSLFFVLGGLAAASTIQKLYLRIFDLPAHKHDPVRVLVWLGLVVGGTFLLPALAPGLRGAAPVLYWIVYLGVAIGFWWFTMWLLLAGRIPWRKLAPSGIATGICWIGMSLVFSITFSGMIISNNQKYGAIGVVFAFMSFFIAVGVVIILGALIGLVWQERGLSFRSAIEKLRRKS